MDYKTLLAQKREELGRRKAEIASLEEEVTTLERAYEIALKAGVVLDGSVPLQAPRAKKTRMERKRKPEKKRQQQGGRTLAAGIREIVQALEPPFTTGQVRELLQVLYEDLHAKTSTGSLAGTMRRMGEIGELEIVEKGGPGKEAKYRLPQETTKPQLVATGTHG